MEKKNIANLNELEFVIFCIENIALKLKVKCRRGLYCTDRKEQYFERLYRPGIRNASYTE